MDPNFFAGRQYYLDPAGVDAYQALYTKAMEAAAAITLAPEHNGYQPVLTVTDGVAVVPVSGYLDKAGLYLWNSAYWAQLQRIRADLSAALEDRAVRGVVLYFDTTGGNVSGISELAADIHAALAVKPVIAYTDGDMLSGGMWLGAAAARRIVSPTANVGSIGVLTMHVDVSEMDKKDGIRRTYLYAGEFKTVGHSAAPLSERDRGIIEGWLSEKYNVFIAAVAGYLQLPEAKVRDELAGGRIFVGRQAVEVGLADAVGSLEDAMEAARTMKPAGTHTAARMLIQPTNPKEAIMPEPITTMEALRAAYPELCQQISEAAAAQVDVTAARTEAATAEADRILGLAAVHFGKDAVDKFSALAKGGVTVDQYAAMKEAMGAVAPSTATTPDPDAAFKARMLADVQQAGAPDVGAGAGGNTGPTDFMAAVRAIAAERNLTRSQAVAVAVKEYPALHQDYVRKANTRAAGA